MSKMVNGINYTCAIVHISQQRTNVGSPAMHKPNMATGGKEVGHNDAVRIRLVGTKSDDKVIKADVPLGESGNLIEKVVGFPVDWWIQKNRITGEEVTGKYDFLKYPTPGVSYEGEILDYAVAYGLIDKAGAWVTWPNGDRSQGRKGAVAYLQENPGTVKELESAIV